MTDTADFLAFAGSARPLVEGKLAAALRKRRQWAGTLGVDTAAMVEALNDVSLRPGKRIRPALLLTAYRAVDADLPLEPAVDAGVALEMLQTYLIVHDDWMDEDDLRRGGPTAHVLLARQFGSRSLGEKAAVVAGDFAAALALQLLLEVDLQREAVTAVLAAFAEAQVRVAAGQLLDLVGRSADWETTYELKTASYTTRGPLLMGALLAKASGPQLAALEQVARPLGIAFQLRDDLIGAFGDSRKTGKAVGNDVTTGKRTALLIETRARLAEDDRQAFDLVWNDPTARRRNVLPLLGRMEAAGARRAVETRLAALVEEAKEAVSSSEFSPRAKTLLLGAISALTDRSG